MRNPSLLPLLSLALLLGFHATAAEQPASTELKEIQECRRNLRLIFEAIQAYRHVHKSIPNSLGELQPAFLSEGRFLICPAARRLGITSADATKWGTFGQTTYGYEFSPDPIPDVISGGSTRSMREWKRLQMGLIGSEVPMVRCHTHERGILNLSFGGRIYESSSLDWEHVFDNIVDPKELWQARRLTAQTIVKKIIVPRRDAQALPTMIDLSDHYNLLLDDAWWPYGESLRPFSGLPLGIAKFNAISFDVRGAVQLGASWPNMIHYPRAISNIVIELRARRVDLLLGVVHADNPGTLVANCVFYLSDGRQQRLPLYYGKHVLTCVSKSEEQFAPPSEGKVAWVAAIGEARTARLYQCQWTNPFPDQVVQRMDFVAQNRNAGPLMVALSVEQ